MLFCHYFAGFWIVYVTHSGHGQLTVELTPQFASTWKGDSVIIFLCGYCTVERWKEAMLSMNILILILCDSLDMYSDNYTKDQKTDRQYKELWSILCVCFKMMARQSGCCFDFKSTLILQLMSWFLIKNAAKLWKMSTPTEEHLLSHQIWSFCFCFVCTHLLLG